MEPNISGSDSRCSVFFGCVQVAYGASAVNESPIYCRCGLPHTQEEIDARRRAIVDEIKRDSQRSVDRYWAARPEQKRVVDAVAAALWPEKNA